MKRIYSAKFVERFSGVCFPGHIRRSREEDFREQNRWRYSPSDEDKNWDWRAIYLACKREPGRYECYSALVASNLQGLQVLDLKSKQTRAGSAIGVDYLATNPANRRADRGFKHVGFGLLGVAIIRSFEAGSQGRLWLESLPAAAGFYENLGLEKLPMLSEDGYAIYVLNSKTAKSLLDQIRTEGIVKL